jgi:protein tyrosine phosphatase (PTP) superfamily phosphohydrolase (DUF442 family)
VTKRNKVRKLALPHRLARPLTFVLLGYIGVSVVGKTVIWIGVVAGRLLDRDPRARDPSLPPIKHFRKVDERLWVAAQPRTNHYWDLAESGVRVVVDVRTGSRADPRPDDPEFLRSLGLDYVWLPVPDGRAPDARTVERFTATVDNAAGIVFLHCGGGVGRSTSLTAAYKAANGQHPSLLEQMAVGPMSLEQAWFIAAVGKNGRSPYSAVIRGLSRYVVDAPRVLWGKIAK